MFRGRILFPASGIVSGGRRGSGGLLGRRTHHSPVGRPNRQFDDQFVADEVGQSGFDEGVDEFRIAFLAHTFVHGVSECGSDVAQLCGFDPHFADVGRVDGVVGGECQPDDLFRLYKLHKYSRFN